MGLKSGNCRSALPHPLNSEDIWKCLDKVNRTNQTGIIRLHMYLVQGNIKSVSNAGPEITQFMGHAMDALSRMDILAGNPHLNVDVTTLIPLQV